MKVIEGDLTDFPEGVNVILQNCNIHAVQGSGLARNIRNKFPEVYQADKDFKVEVGPKRFGNFSYVDLSSDNSKRVYNLYGQDLGMEFPLNVNAFMKALEKSLVHISTEVDKPKIGIPWLICCGLCNGDFTYIRPIVEFFVENYNIDAVWVKFNG